MQMLISEEGVSKKLMVQAQQAVAKAGEHVNTAVRCIESKKKHAQGHGYRQHASSWIQCTAPDPSSKIAAKA